MKKIANLSSAAREELFLVTAREKALPEAVIEKDFWVCWTLDYLFHDSPWKEHLAFKGGSMRLMPPDNCLPALSTDYEHMKNMIFGEIPAFEEVLSTIQLLAEEINTLCQ